MQTMFDAPSANNVEKVVITAECVRNRTAPLLVQRPEVPEPEMPEPEASEPEVPESAGSESAAETEATEAAL